MEYLHNVVRPSLFGKEQIKVLQKDTASINNNISNVPEIIDNSNRINGISIIGSVSPEFNRTTHNKDDADHKLSYMNTHNPEYAFVNDGYVEDAKEETYL